MTLATGFAMRHIDPQEHQLRDVHSLLLGGVSPRPIALVGTVSALGKHNLAPFSFFNAFGANPPIVAFSAARRGTDGSYKDTYRNLMETGECTIQIVSHAMVEQMNLCSAEVPAGVDEFPLSGFTPLDSDKIAPKRVAESRFHMECVLRQMVPLGEGNGSGNLAICEVVKFHIAEDLFDVYPRIDPHKLDAVARNGALYYTRASGDAIFEVPRPVSATILGWNGLPSYMRNSTVYSANNLGRFANWERIPAYEDAVKAITALGSEIHLSGSRERMEREAKAAVENGDMELAWNWAVCAGGAQ